VSLTRPQALPARSVAFTSLSSVSPAIPLLLLFQKHDELTSSCCMLQATDTAAQQGRKAADTASATADTAAEDMSQVGPDTPESCCHVSAQNLRRSPGHVRAASCNTPLPPLLGLQHGRQLCPTPTAGCWMQTVGRATGAAADAAEATKPKASDIGSKAYDATAQVQPYTVLLSTFTEQHKMSSGDCAPPAMDGAAERPGHSW
jgi:hypothetical protein